MTVSIIILSVVLAFFSCQNFENKAKTQDPNSSVHATLSKKMFDVQAMSLPNPNSVYGLWEAVRVYETDREIAKGRLLIEENKITLAAQCDFTRSGGPVVYASTTVSTTIGPQFLTFHEYGNNSTVINSEHFCETELEAFTTDYAIGSEPKRLYIRMWIGIFGYAEYEVFSKISD